jgi:hypothetical protein
MKFSSPVLLVALASIVACGGRDGENRADGGSPWQDLCTSYTPSAKFAETTYGGPLGVPYNEYDCKSEKYGDTTVMVSLSAADKDAARPIMKIWARSLDPNMDIVNEEATWLQLGLK